VSGPVLVSDEEPVRNPFVAMLGLGALDVALARKVLAPQRADG
jgi:hypothetical protein